MRPMSQQIRDLLQKILQEPLPLRFRIIHGIKDEDPIHTKVTEILCGRRALRQLEAHAMQRTSRPLQPSSEEQLHDSWADGFLEGLLFWVRAARGLSEWEQSIALELRDVLWSEGHQLSLDEPWEDALFRAAALLGLIPGSAALKRGSRVQVLTYGLTESELERFEGMADFGFALLRSLAHREGQYLVEKVEKSGQVVVREDKPYGRSERFPRYNLWPMGCPELTNLRERVELYSKDALQHMLQWSNSHHVSIDQFVEDERAECREKTQIWKCKKAPATLTQTEATRGA